MAQEPRTTGPAMDSVESLRNRLGIKGGNGADGVHDREAALLALFRAGSLPRLLLQLETGRICEVNSAACTFYRRERDLFLETTWSEITVTPSSEPDRLFAEALDQGRSAPIRATQRTALGDLLEVELHVQPVQLFEKRLAWIDVQNVSQSVRARKVQDLLLDIASAASVTRDLYGLLDTIRSKLSSFLDTKNFYVALYDERTRLYSFPFYADEKDEQFKPDPLQGSLTDYVRRSARSLLLKNDEQDELVQQGEIEGVVGTPSAIWLGVPLRTARGVIGVVGVQHYTDPKAYDETDLHLLEFVSDAIAVTVERRRVEQALRESEERFRSFVERSPDGIWCVDLFDPVSTELPIEDQVRQIVHQARFIECNETFVRMYGFSSREEVLGKGLHDLPAETDRERSDASLGSFVREHYRMSRGESWETLQDGTQKVFDNQLIGILEGGNLVRIWGSQRDITSTKFTQQEVELRRAHLESFIRNSSEGIVFVDAQDVIRQVNRSFIELFGYGEEELLGQQNTLIVPDHLRAESDDLFREAVSEESIHRVTVRQKKSGDLIDVDILGTPIRIEGELHGTYWVYRDITERTRAEAVQRAIFHIAAAAATSEDLTALLQQVHHHLGTLIDTTNFYVALYDSDQGGYRFTYFVDERDEVDPGRVYSMDGTVTDYVRREGPTFFGASDGSDIPDWLELGEQTGPMAKSWLGVPLRVPGDTIGVAVVQSYTKHEAYDDQDRELLEYVSDHIAVAIEHQRNRDAIRASEERYRTLFDQSPVGVLIFDTDLTIVDGNDRMLAMLGVREEVFLGIKLDDLEDDRVAISARKALSGGDERFEGLYRSTLSGREIWIRGNVARLTGADGEVIGGLILVEDITEQQRTSHELELQKAHTELLFEKAPEAIALLNEDLQVLRVNEEFSSFFGFSQDETEGTDLSALVPEEKREEEARLVQRMQAGEGFSLETRRRRKDGTMLDVLMLGEAISVLGEHSAYYLIYRDITERKRIETLQRALYNIARQAATTHDLKNFIATVRDELARIIDTTNFSVALYDPGVGRYTFPYHVDEHDVFDETRQYDLSGSLTDLVRANAEPMLVTQEDYEAFESDGLVRPRGVRAVSWMGVPLRHGERVAGVLGVVSYDSHTAFTAQDLDVLEFVSDQIMSMIEHIRAELALLESEKRYKTLFDQSPVGVLLFDETLRVREANERLADILGVSHDQLFENSLTEIAGTDLVQRFRGVLSGQPSEYSGSHRRASDGRELWLEVSSTPHHGPRGDVTGGIAVIQDNTAQRDTERRAELNRLYLEQLFEGAPEAIVLLDPRFRVIRLNHEFSRMFGFGIGDLLGQSLLDNLLASGDKAEEHRSVFERVSSGETVRLDETVGLRKDGSSVDVSLLATPILIDDEVIALYAIYRDITARKSAVEALGEEKERLAVTLEAIADAVITTDESGRIVLINRAALQLTGWSEEEAVGRTIGEVLPLDSIKGEERDGASRFVEHAHKNLREEREDLLENRRGERRTVTTSAAPIHDVDSRTTGAVIVVRDVTQQRELEDEIAKIERLESVGVLAGGIAHDFNNILSAVLGNISIAKMATDDESMRDDRIAEAERAALRARDLTQQLLTFARGGEPVRKSVDLEAIVREAVTFGLRGSKAGHTIECEPDLWPVEADEGQIGRVINNLVINADQAMPQGGKVTVEVRNIEVGPERNLPLEPGRYVFVRIADEGIGIPDELLQRIFDPFFTTKQRGSGLGLATSFSIVQKHDGHMAVESEVGKGTAFTIYLPVSEKKPTDALQEDEIAFQGRGRVLVMDDEEPVQEVVRVMLEEMGFEVVTVGDGARMLEAYQQARMREEPFDVVIMDLTIPGGMGGEEAIAHLLRLDPDVRAIVASGYSNDPVMAEYRKHGFRGMVAKPFGYDDLVKAMKAVMA